MPTYEYYCSSCNKKFDKFQSISDEPLDKCPDCSTDVKRLISGGSGFIMKGGNTMELPACGKGSPCCSSGTCGMQGGEGCGF